jgi:hypothetical protein
MVTAPRPFWWGNSNSCKNFHFFSRLNAYISLMVIDISLGLVSLDRSYSDAHFPSHTPYLQSASFRRYGASNTLNSVQNEIAPRYITPIVLLMFNKICVN